MIPEKDPFQRFAWGAPPQKQGDYAYLLHIIRSIKSTGKAACILPHGVLFRGNAEAVIRQKLVRSGYLKGIIGLPANLFYGTGIPACILVLDKENATARKGIFMIDASKGFVKDGNKNRLREQDIHRIVDTFRKQVDVPRYARIVSFEEIADARNDYNLNLPRYIDSSEPEDIQDIEGHLRGGIPERDIDALDRYWRVIPGVRVALFEKADRPGYCQLRLPISGVKAAIFGHAEFAAFIDAVTGIFDRWKQVNIPHLKGFDRGGQPKALIEAISEDLLAAFRHAPLLDAYDVFQHLMDYWAETMQDDCYLIAADGWQKAAHLRLLIEDRKARGKTRPDLVAGKKKYLAELIPPGLVIARYFAAEQAAIEMLEADMAGFQQQMEEMAKEHTGEDGLLAEALNDKGRLTKASAIARLREIKGDPDAVEEREAIGDYLALVEQEAAVGAKLKAAQEALTAKLIAKYPKLSEEEIKALVVEDKWLASLSAAVQGELDRVSQTLTGRIRQLAERYAAPLPQLADEVDALSARVYGHLKKMGVAWK